MHIGPLFWDARLSDQSISVEETIAAAEAILPGRPAPDDEADPRWKAVIAVAEFIPSDPELVWSFILRWGVSQDADLRMAIAFAPWSTCFSYTSTRFTIVLSRRLLEIRSLPIPSPTAGCSRPASSLSGRPDSTRCANHCEGIYYNNESSVLIQGCVSGPPQAPPISVTKMRRA